MAQLSPLQILEEMHRQMLEDVAADADMRAIAAMSDAELDAELRSSGLDPAQLEAQAAAMFQAHSAPAKANGGAVHAVFQAPARLEAAPQRRRPVAVAVWLAAAAVTATAAGGLIYTWMQTPHDQPAPVPPAPSPSATPAPSLPPDLVALTPADTRKKAAAALDSGDPSLCLRLLDEARMDDPAGDETPEVKALRKRAVARLMAK